MSVAIKNNVEFRYAFIDAIRGIAACVVMLQHSLESSGVERLIPGAFALSWINFGEVGVLAFFLVSGFVIPLSLERWNDVGHFWVNRILRIYPLYICVYAATLALTALLGRSLPHNLAVNFLCNLSFLQQYVKAQDFVGGSWTLSLEACWYLGSTLLFVLALHKRYWVYTVLVVLVAAACWAASWGPMVRIPMGRVSLLAACVVGLLCYRKERGDLNDTQFALASGVLWGVIFINLTVGFLWRPSGLPTEASYRCVAISWILGAAVFLVPYFHRKSAMYGNAALRYLGKISYSIYLVHAVVLLALSRTGLSGLAFVLVVPLLTIPIASLSYIFIESPGIKFAHGLRLRKRAAAQEQ